MTEDQKKRFFDYLDSESFDEHIDKMIKEENKATSESIAFFETLEFKNILEAIVSSKEERISSDDWHYSKGYDFITEKDFNKLYDSVFAKLSDNIIEEDVDFEQLSLSYRGINFIQISGQGTIRYIEKTLEAKSFIIKDKLEGF
jgi:hypothetical protein